MAGRVTTVLGPVASADLGITDAHNHLWISNLRPDDPPGPVLDQEEGILAELALYREAGGRSQLDCQPGEAGRDGAVLARLAENSGLNIIACTGFHLREYYPEENGIWNRDADQAAAYFLDEINGGLLETRDLARAVYPGFIKIAVRESLESSPLALLEGAAAASLESGLMIEMHTQRGSGVEEFVEYFLALGLDPGRLVVCHIDKRPDQGLHLELAKAGCLLEYDTFFRPKYQPEENLWPIIRFMVENGQDQALACATDLAEVNLWSVFGDGPGLAGLITIIRRRLLTELEDQTIVDKLTGGNIARKLVTVNQE